MVGDRSTTRAAYHPTAPWLSLHTRVDGKENASHFSPAKLNAHRGKLICHPYPDILAGILPSCSRNRQLTSERNRRYLLIRKATANIRVYSWKPDLSKVGLFIAPQPPHGRTKCRTPFIQRKSMECILDIRVDIKAFES
jgi:hypothetical protein